MTKYANSHQRKRKGGHDKSPQVCVEQTVNTKNGQRLIYGWGLSKRELFYNDGGFEVLCQKDEASGHIIHTWKGIRSIEVHFTGPKRKGKNHAKKPDCMIVYVNVWWLSGHCLP